MLPKGKFVRIDPSNPDAVARCDRSGQLCNYNDLVKQYEYRGSGLVWTGLYVNKYFLDKPNPQGMNPLIKRDPVSLEHPRPWQTLQDTPIEIEGKLNVTENEPWAWRDGKDA
jgi:hypothetical protein